MNKLDLEETTRRFHNIYEQVAKEYGYKTREDTKELDFNSPNGMTMLKTVEMITTPYLEEIEILKEEYKKNCEDKNKYISTLEESLNIAEERYLKLDNIINELEKWLEEEYQYADKHIFPGSYAGVAMGQINRTKNKLQELKGSDKE